MMNNGRPLGQKKTVRVLVALTILVWATQTLIHQWGYGAPVPAESTGEQFVPPDVQLRSAAMELKADATVVGTDVRLKQICRWSQADSPVFDPIGNLILFRLTSDHPYRSWSMDELKQTLRDAGVNLAMIRFSGATSCMVSRSDVHIDEADALQQWIAAHEPQAPQERPTPVAMPATQPASTVSAQADSQVKPAAENLTLQQMLVRDLAQRLSLSPDAIQMRFSPADEKTLALSEPQFQFNIQPESVRNLGNVAWEVTIFAAGSSQKVEIKAQAFAWQQQVVLMRPLADRQIIRQEDVVSRRALVSQVANDPLLTMDQVLGQQAAMQLRPGTVFTARMVEAVPLVRTGQLVTIILSQGDIQVKTVGRAMENGAFGQTIRVRNERTRDMYEAVVTGQQTARLGGVEVANGQ